MASNVKKLGDFIVPIDLRNSDERFGEGELRGISVTKEFITSHANLVGVSFKGYKVVPSRSFAYIPDTSRRGDKIAIAYNGSKKTLIVSSICSVFGIEDESKLLPEYLMLWLSRSEFDRYARFKSHGSAREVFDWEQLCNVELPVPPIENQKRVLAIKQAIDRRMASLAKLNDYLEQLCQTLFDRFDADENNSFVSVADIANVNPKRAIKKGEKALCVEMADLSTRGSFPSGWRTKAYNGGMKFKNGDTIMARITPCLENGKTGYVNFLDEGQIAFGSTEYIVMATKGELPSEYFYFLARNSEFVAYAVAHMNGSSGRQRVSGDDIEKYEVRMPSEEQLDEFTKVAIPAMQTILANSIENRRLAELRSALLPKLMSDEIDVSKIDLTQLNNHLLADPNGLRTDCMPLFRDEQFQRYAKKLS